MKPIIPLHGNPGTTISMMASDAVQSFELANLSLNDKSAVAALITCELFNIRFTCGFTTPSQADNLGHLLLSGQSLKLSNSAAIRNFKFINAVNGSNARLQITFEFMVGA